MSQRYRIILTGKTLDGSSLESRRAQFGAAFRLNPQQLDQVLCGRPVVLRKDTEETEAQAFLSRLKALGLDARAEPLAASPAPAQAPRPAAPVAIPVPPPAAPPPSACDLFALEPMTPRAVDQAAPEVPPDGVVCPKCGEVQPKRNLCRQCGLDMPRYLANQAAMAAEARQSTQADKAATINGGTDAPPGFPQRASLRVEAVDAADHEPSLLGLRFFGRANRLNYLASQLLSILLALIALKLIFQPGTASMAQTLLVVAWAYSVRVSLLRLKDMGLSPWLWLLNLIPFAGQILQLAILFLPGERNENTYGPPPAPATPVNLVVMAVLAVGIAISGARLGSGFMAAIQEARSGTRSSPENSAAASPNADLGALMDVEVFTDADCSDCREMTAWMDREGISYYEQALDKDPAAKRRLASLERHRGRGHVALPVVRVGEDLLWDNPSRNQVQQQVEHLYQED